MAAYVDLPWTVNRAMRRLAARQRKGGGKVKRIRVKPLHDINGVPLLAVRPMTPEEAARVDEWQRASNEAQRTGVAPPVPVLFTGDLQVPATVITVARWAINSWRPATTADIVTAYDLYQRLKGMADTAKVLDLEEAEYTVVKKILAETGPAAFNVSYHIVERAFDDVVVEEPSANGHTPPARARAAARK